MLISAVAFALTDQDISNCEAEKKCSEKQGVDNLTCRADCAQVPYGDSGVVEKYTSCEKECNTNADCISKCVADFITQKGGEFVSSANNGIKDKLVPGQSSSNSSGSSNNGSNNNGNSESTNSAGNSVTFGVVGALSFMIVQ